MLPPTTRRVRSKDDVWCQIARLQSEEAKTARIAAQKVALERREALRVALVSQLHEKSAAKRAEEDAEREYGLRVVNDAEGHVKRSQEEERKKKSECGQLMFSRVHDFVSCTRMVVVIGHVFIRKVSKDTTIRK